jgi:hypothetical protein
VDRDDILEVKKDRDVSDRGCGYKMRAGLEMGEDGDTSDYDCDY